VFICKLSRKDYAAVKQAPVCSYSSGQTEGQITRLEAAQAQLKGGRAGLDLYGAMLY